MGISYRKRIKICKGLYMNISKKGISFSTKIGNTTINSSGRVTTKLGKGITHTTNLNKLKKKK